MIAENPLDITATEQESDIFTAILTLAFIVLATTGIIAAIDHFIPPGPFYSSWMEYRVTTWSEHAGALTHYKRCRSRDYRGYSELRCQWRLHPDDPWMHQ